MFATEESASPSATALDFIERQQHIVPLRPVRSSSHEVTGNGYRGRSGHRFENQPRDAFLTNAALRQGIDAGLKTLRAACPLVTLAPRTRQAVGSRDLKMIDALTLDPIGRLGNPAGQVRGQRPAMIVPGEAHDADLLGVNPLPMPPHQHQSAFRRFRSRRVEDRLGIRDGRQGDEFFEQSESRLGGEGIRGQERLFGR